MGKKLSEVDRAYIAGFLDADGAIMATIERHQEKRFGFRVRVELKISQSNRSILDWLYKKTAVGYIRRNRTTHDWVVRDQLIVKHMINILRPYLKAKRTQASQALKILESKINSKKDLLSVARSADALSRLNVRSKNRRKNYATMIEDTISRND